MNTGQIEYVVKIQTNQPNYFFFKDLNNDGIKEINFFEQSVTEKTFISFELSSERILYKITVPIKISPISKKPIGYLKFNPVFVRNDEQSKSLAIAVQKAILLMDLRKQTSTIRTLDENLLCFIPLNNNRLLFATRENNQIHLGKLSFSTQKVEETARRVQAERNHSNIFAQKWIISGRPYVLLTEFNKNTGMVKLSIYDMDLRLVREKKLNISPQITLNDLRPDPHKIAFPHLQNQSIQIIQLEGLMENEAHYSVETSADSIGQFYYFDQIPVFWGSLHEVSLITTSDPAYTSSISYRLPGYFGSSAEILHITNRNVTLFYKNSIYRLALSPVQKKSLLPLGLVGLVMCGILILMGYWAHGYFHLKRPFRISTPFLLTEQNSIRIMSPTMQSLLENYQSNDNESSSNNTNHSRSDKNKLTRQPLEIIAALKQQAPEYQFDFLNFNANEGFCIYGMQEADMSLLYLKGFLSFILKNGKKNHQTYLNQWNLNNIEYIDNLLQHIIQIDWNVNSSVNPVELIRQQMDRILENYTPKPIIQSHFSHRNLLLNESALNLIISELLTNLKAFSAMGKSDIYLQLIDDPSQSFSKFLEITISNPIEKTDIPAEQILAPFQTSNSSQLGLGLTLVDYLIKKTSGKIHVTLLEHSGFSIVITLPTTLQDH